MNSSSIFFSKISVIDHARMTSNGLIGGSYNLSAVASIPTDKMDEEQVVVDFSSGKKWLKEKIDAHDFNTNLNGFDHKLWVHNQATIKFDGDNADVEDSFVHVYGPKDMFKFIDMSRNQMNHMDTFAQVIENHVKENFVTRETYNIMLDEDPYPNTVCCLSNYYETRMFSYTHGLPMSSSFGCKNIAHGHKSFVRIGSTNLILAKHLADLFADYLNNAYIFNSMHRKDERKFEYTTCRGHMMMEFAHDYPQLKLIEMTKEPTIENILDFVCEKFKNSITDPITVMISEGLQKGAIKKIA